MIVRVVIEVVMVWKLNWWEEEEGYLIPPRRRS